MAPWFARQKLLRILQLEGVDPSASILEKIIESDNHNDAREAIADVISPHCEAEMVLNRIFGIRIKASFL